MQSSPAILCLACDGDLTASGATMLNITSGEPTAEESETDQIILAVVLSVLGLAIMLGLTVICGFTAIRRRAHRARSQQLQQQARERDDDPEIPVEPNICYDSMSMDYLSEGNEYDDVISVPQTLRVDPQPPDYENIEPLTPAYENIEPLTPAYEDIEQATSSPGLPLPSKEDVADPLHQYVNIESSTIARKNTTLASYRPLQHSTECEIHTQENAAYAVGSQSTAN